MSRGIYNFIKVAILFMMLTPEVKAQANSNNPATILFTSSSGEVQSSIYSWERLPFGDLAGVYTIEDEIEVESEKLDSRLYLYIPPTAYPYEIEVNGVRVASWGDLQNSKTMANFSATTIPLEGVQERNNLRITFYSDGQTWAFPKLWIGTSEEVGQRSFIQTLLNKTLINAIVISSLISAILFFALAAAEEFAKKDMIYLSAYHVLLSLSYMNFLFNSPFSNEMLWFTISRISLIYLITMLFFYVTESTKILNMSPIRIALFLISIPFLIMLLGAKNKYEIHEIHLISVVWIYRPIIVLLIGIFIYSLFKKDRKNLYIQLIGFIIVVVTSLRDARMLELKEIPFFWIVPYGYFGQSITLIATVFINQSRLLRKTNDSEKRLEKSNLELQEKQKLLQEESHSKDLFIRTVAHELRTPLSGLQGAMSELKEGRANDLRVQEAFRTSIYRLSSSVNNIIDYEAIKRGTLTTSQYPFKVKELFDSIIKIHREDALSKGISLIFVFRESLIPPYLIGDAGRLTNTLHNLLSNAVKFTKKGGVYCEVDYKMGMLSITLADTGCGINLEEEKLFSDSQDAENRLTREYDGIGIGLYIVRETVFAMGGDIKLVRDEAQGAQFLIEIPMHPADQLATSQGEGETILITDDNEINRLMLMGQLKKLNYNYICAENGKVALEAIVAKKDSICAILMDVQMPVMDGLTATRAIKEISPTTPVIGVTANADMEECFAAGMDDVIYKPASIEQIHHSLQRFLKIYKD